MKSGHVFVLSKCLGHRGDACVGGTTVAHGLFPHLVGGFIEMCSFIKISFFSVSVIRSQMTVIHTKAENITGASL